MSENAVAPAPSLFRQVTPGVLLCLGLSLVAQGLAHYVPIVGAAVFAIVLGILVNNVLPVPKVTKPGVSYSSKRILQLSIILLGGSLSLAQVLKAGQESLVVMLLTLGLALVLALILGRLLKIGRILTTLIGVGTGICGGSAIAAVAPIVEADDEDIAFAISTVFMFNVIAVVVFPALGHLMHMTQNGFGIWSGTAINDTSSVVAAAFSYGREAGEMATVTKLARTTMIVPIALVLALWVSRCGGSDVKCDFKKVFPWFILGFLGLSIANSLGLLNLVNAQLPAYFGRAGKFCIAVALAGVGLGADLRKMVRTGPKPLILGLLCWIGVAVSSLLVQHLMGQS